MRSIVTAIFVALPYLVGSAQAKSFAEMFPDRAASYPPEAITALSSMDFQQGKTTVGNNLATLDLGEDFYFLGPKDARHVRYRCKRNEFAVN